MPLCPWCKRFKCKKDCCNFLLQPNIDVNLCSHQVNNPKATRVQFQAFMHSWYVLWLVLYVLSYLNIGGEETIPPITCNIHNYLVKGCIANIIISSSWQCMHCAWALHWSSFACRNGLLFSTIFTPYHVEKRPTSIML